MQRKYLKIIPLKSFVGLENLVKLSFYQQVFFYHFIQGFTHVRVAFNILAIFRNGFKSVKMFTKKTFFVIGNMKVLKY